MFRRRTSRGEPSASSNPRPFSTLLRPLVLLLIAYLLLLAFVSAAPALFPSLCRPLIPVAVKLGDSYRVDEVRMEEGDLVMTASCRVFRSFTDHEGRPGPIIRFEGSRSIQGMSVYPVLAFALLAAIPVRGRRKLIMAAAVLIMVILAAVADTVLMLYWTGAQTCAEQWDVIKTGIPSTPGNIESFQALLTHIDRLARILHEWLGRTIDLPFRVPGSTIAPNIV